MSSNSTEECAPDDQLCIVRVHEVEVIVIPTLLLFFFLVFMLWILILKFCRDKKSSSSHSYNLPQYRVNQPQPQRHQHQSHHHHHQNHQHDNHHPNHQRSQNKHPNHRRDDHRDHHHDNHQRQEQKQQRHSSPRRQNNNNNGRHRSQLQGIDAPAGINPMEHEEVPMTVQNSKPQVAAVPRATTERQPRAFSQINALPQTFFIKPDHSVTLYRAQMDRKDVVLRVLKDSPSAAEKQQFVGFASFLSALGPHPFLPTLLGVVTAQPPLMIAIEELQHRDLLSFLWKCRQDNSEPGCDMTEKRIYSMARQLASALDYLHSKQVVHGNVAARSVLVGRDLSVKLWGFGSAFRRQQSRSSGNVGTLGSSDLMELRKWQAPEVLSRTGLSKSSDVWSFGILLYEMVTLGDPPFPQIMATELLQFLQRGKFLRKPATCSNTLFSLIKSCCHWSPQQRLSLPELSRKLESGERTANGNAVLRVPDSLDVGQYLREAGYGEAYNYAVF